MYVSLLHGSLSLFLFNVVSAPSQALQRTLEFEEELAKKFSGGTTNSRSREYGNDVDDVDEGENSNKRIVSDIQKKYEKKLALHRGGGTEQVLSKLLHVLLSSFLYWVVQLSYIFYLQEDKQKELLIPGAGVSSSAISL